MNAKSKSKQKGSQKVKVQDLNPKKSPKGGMRKSGGDQQSAGKPFLT
jgi:hypothetical protein